MTGKSDFFEVVSQRRSIRRYKSYPVPEELLTQVLDAARLAPSWKNMQCWRFLVLTEPEKKTALLTAFHEENPGRKSLEQAPAVIVVCADPSESGHEEGKDYYLADTAIAFEHLCLAAQAVGLGTCWLGWFREGELKSNLGIPEKYRVVGVTPLGFPDQAPKPRPRKSLEEIVCFNAWEL
ncbi:MAG: nitroreductase family protein [Desulfuromonadales bacterium]|nr:nitroreductase family protein [Desulfuromonadales bacterium]